MHDQRQTRRVGMIFGIDTEAQNLTSSETTDKRRSYNS